MNLVTWTMLSPAEESLVLGVKPWGKSVNAAQALQKIMCDLCESCSLLAAMVSRVAACYAGAPPRSSVLSASTQVTHTPCHHQLLRAIFLILNMCRGGGGAGGGFGGAGGGFGGGGGHSSGVNGAAYVHSSSSNGNSGSNDWWNRGWGK